jgi:hypothetical protein
LNDRAEGSMRREGEANEKRRAPRLRSERRACRGQAMLECEGAGLAVSRSLPLPFASLATTRIALLSQVCQPLPRRVYQPSNQVPRERKSRVHRRAAQCNLLTAVRARTCDKRLSLRTGGVIHPMHRLATIFVAGLYPGGRNAKQVRDTPRNRCRSATSVPRSIRPAEWPGYDEPLVRACANSIRCSLLAPTRRIG